MKPGDIVKMKSGGTSMLESDSYEYEKNRYINSYIIHDQLGIVLELSRNVPPPGCCGFVKIFATGSGWVPEHYLEIVR